LEYYQDGIYKLRKDTSREEITIDNKILNKFVETSDYNLLAILLRMYYILSSSNNVKIQNIEFKKELLKSIIEEIKNPRRRAAGYFKIVV
jgi:hypothetical protein